MLPERVIAAYGMWSEGLLACVCCWAWLFLARVIVRVGGRYRERWDEVVGCLGAVWGWLGRDGSQVG